MADFWTAVQIQKSKTEHFFLTLSNPSLEYVSIFCMTRPFVRMIPLHLLLLALTVATGGTYEPRLTKLSTTFATCNTATRQWDTKQRQAAEGGRRDRGETAGSACGFPPCPPAACCVDCLGCMFAAAGRYRRNFALSEMPPHEMLYPNL